MLKLSANFARARMCYDLKLYCILVRAIFVLLMQVSFAGSVRV